MFGPTGISSQRRRSAKVSREKNRRRGVRDPARAAELQRVLIDDEREQPADAAALIRADRRRRRAGAALG